MTLTQPPQQRGVARLYDHCLRLVVAVHAPANGPTVNLNQGFMFSYGALVTFTRTASEDEAVELLKQLRPMFSPHVHVLSQPGGKEYVLTVDRARWHAGHYAGGAYVEPCPTCSAPSHSPCREGASVLPDAHPKRAATADKCTAARLAAFHADPGNVVWTGREPLRPELRRTVPAR
jgi:hypothetical protein